MASLTKKLIKGRAYYYLRETARVGGRPKVVRTVYLGRADDILERLERASEPARVESRSFGAVAAALKLTRLLGAVEAVDRACPTRSQGPSVGTLIALAAVNRAVCARSKRAFADWYAQTALARLVPLPQAALSSQRFWDAMDRLGEAEIAQAEAEIARAALERFALEPETLVYDKGNNSKANQALADELSLALVGSLVPSHYPDLLAIPRERFRPLAGDPETLVCRARAEVFGRERTVVVSHSQRFHARQRRGLAQTLLKARRALWELRGVVERGKHRMDEARLQARIAEITKPRWLSQLVQVEANLAASRFRFTIDQTRLAALDAELFGKRLIFSDRDDWTDEQIVAAYRAQAKAERAFRQMKHPAFGAFSPAFHWTDQKLRVHAFVCTLALTIVHLIEREARRAGIDTGAEQILRQLSEIDEVTLLYPPAGERQGRPRARRRIAEMDADQSRLYDALGLAELAPR
jgi:hypothetical protein